MKMKSWMIMMSACALTFGGAAACGGDDEGSGGGTSTGSSTGTSTGSGTGTNTGTSSGSGTGTNTGTGSGTGSGTGTGSLVHGCSMALAEDMTGMATVNLDWTNPHSRCILVDVGTDVVWTATPSFTAHPLAGGVSPTDDDNFISQTDQSGATATVTFDTAGDYPYFCTSHPVGMSGVVYVE